MDTTTVIFIMLVNWLATTIFVESSLFAPARDWIVRKSQRVVWKGQRLKLPFTFPEGTTPEEAAEAQIIFTNPWAKVGQLVTCHMCTGTWVGFIQAAVFGGPFAGWYAVIANGLLYKAGGHLILELRSRVAKVDAGPPPPTAEVTSEPVDHQ